ncbi:MAG: TSUP family transporter [Veillonellaceae bacterium]|nr:TSUP family transporter [Veillonellaceae bacterium]
MVEMSEWWIGAALFAAGFLSAFIDSVVGGGGLISLPAMLLTGLPPTVALGTNKLAAVCGVLTSSLTFWRRGHVEKTLVVRLLPAAFFASMLGSYTVMHVSPAVLEPLIVMALLLVAGFVLYRKDFGRVSYYAGRTRTVWLTTLAAALGFGFYDGFIGPGTGAFFMLAMVTVGFDFVGAAGNSRCLNAATNLGSLLFFLGAGQVHWIYGLMMAGGMVAGGYFGARTAIARGSSFVRMIFILVVGALILRLAWGYWGN